MLNNTIQWNGIAIPAETPGRTAMADFVGECYWELTPTLFRLLEDVTFEQQSQSGHIYRMTYGEYRREEQGGELRLDADWGIAALAWMVENDTTEGISWHGNCAAFWLFHDLSHAEDDAWASTDTVGINLLTGYDEDRANLDGAQAAMEAGLEGPSILRELLGLKNGFRARFGFPSMAAEEWLRTATVDNSGNMAEAKDVAQSCIIDALADGEDLDWALERVDVHVYECSDPFALVVADPGGMLDDAIETFGLGLGIDAWASYLFESVCRDAVRDAGECPECQEGVKPLGGDICSDCASMEVEA